MTKTVSQPKASVTCKAIKNDEGWFKKHPNRTWRIRPFIAGEDYGRHDPPPDGVRAYTLVERLPSGAHMRRFVMSRSPLCQFKHSDAAIKALFVAWFLHTPKEDMFSIGDAPEGSPISAQINALADVCGVDPDNSNMLAARIATMIDPWTASVGASI